MYTKHLRQHVKGLLFCHYRLITVLNCAHRWYDYHVLNAQFPFMVFVCFGNWIISRWLQSYLHLSWAYISLLLSDRWSQNQRFWQRARLWPAGTGSTRADHYSTTNHERTHYEALKKENPQLKSEVARLRQEIRDKDGTITSLQKSLADALKQGRGHEFLSDKFLKVSNDHTSLCIYSKRNEFCSATRKEYETLDQGKLYIRMHRPLQCSINMLSWAAVQTSRLKDDDFRTYWGWLLFNKRCFI